MSRISAPFATPNPGVSPGAARRAWHAVFASLSCDVTGGHLNKILRPLLVAEPQGLAHAPDMELHGHSFVIPIGYDYLTEHVLDSFLVPNHALRKRHSCGVGSLRFDSHLFAGQEACAPRSRSMEADGLEQWCESSHASQLRICSRARMPVGILTCEALPSFERAFEPAKGRWA